VGTESTNISNSIFIYPTEDFPDEKTALPVLHFGPTGRSALKLMEHNIKLNVILRKWVRGELSAIGSVLHSI
jgi:hypothetical protein